MKAKPIILVIITLIIGFVIGMLTSAQIRLHKMQPVRVYFSEGRFRDGFYKTIQPDEQQKAEIEKILDKYAKLNGDLQGGFRKSYDSTMKEFRKELDAKLTKDQLARLKEMDERRMEMIKQSFRDRNNQDSTRRPDPRWREREGGRPFPDRPPRQGDPDHPGPRPDSARVSQ